MLPLISDNPHACTGMICNKMTVGLWILKRVQVRKEMNCAARIAHLGKPNHILQRTHIAAIRYLGEINCSDLFIR
jgi:hypothetical protein